MILDPNKIYIILTYGQSNALGIANTSDVLDPILNPPIASKNYKVEWDWTNSVFILSENKQVVRSINDNDWNRISPSYYTVEALDKKLTSASLANPVFINIAAGRGAVAVAGLSKSSTYYTKILNAITFVKAQFPTKTIEVLFMSWIHGESDSYYYSDAAAYTALLIQLKNDLNTDIAAITGQSSRIPIYLNQLSWGIGAQGEGNEVRIIMKEYQRELTTADAELIYVMPTYQLDTATQDPSKPGSDIHFSGYSLLQLGEMLADAYFKKEILGTSFITLNNFFCQRIASNKIAVKLTDAQFLQIDPFVITYNRQKGFEFRDDSNVEIPITKVEVAENDIVVTLQSDFTSGKLYYCYTQPFTVNSVTYKRQKGAIKSISSIQSVFTGQTFYYYLPAFYTSVK